MLGDTLGRLKEVIAFGIGVPSVSGHVVTDTHFQCDSQRESIGATLSEERDLGSG